MLEMGCDASTEGYCLLASLSELGVVGRSKSFTVSEFTRGSRHGILYCCL